MKQSFRRVLRHDFTFLQFNDERLRWKCYNKQIRYWLMLFLYFEMKWVKIWPSDFKPLY